MRKWLNNYFDFTKSEFNGFLVLIVLIILVTAAPYAYSLVIKNDYSQEDYLVVKRLILKNETKNAPSKFNGSSYERKSVRLARKKTPLFYFDPNLIVKEEWMLLGLSEKQAGAILKYIEKGGQFRRVEDLKKMYTISPEKYLELSPYVKIPATASTLSHYIKKAESSVSTNPNPTPVAIATGNFVKAPKKPAVMVELNAADSASLDDIRGIGPAFALRILNYRERVGGYVSTAQLMEVFGLDSLKYSEIKDQVRVDASLIRKININTATAENFKNHPYLRFKQINAIIQYRKQHGNYSNIADLSKVVVIPAETIARLAPYLIY
jgi:competence protein ComEA